ncbi:MAG TPA: TadE/TadG family type IV pilus assembly protein [Sphingomicrobium sp.]|jgi:Flp pilus assembly pilin Flp|nr:TadE/TadG family type IV pilus assembly protein [Sphingomicrobium sp.]
MMARFASLRRDERGNSLIEMALAAPLLAAFLVGMVDISRAVAAKVQLEQISQRMIEKVQAQDFDTDQAAALETEAEAAAGTGSSADVTAWLECNHDGAHLDFDSGSCGDGVPFARYVSISVGSTFSPIFGTRYFPGANADGTVDVGGKATVRVQ